MKSTVRILTGVTTIAILITNAVVQAQAFTFPESPTAPVITLDYQGDRLKRINDAPTLTVLANGSVFMPQSYAHTQAYQSHISQSELQQLMDFVVRENQFFDYDANQVEAKLGKLKRQPLPVHFSTTVINVNVADRSKEVRIRQLGHGPMVEETSRMLAIEQRLDQLMSFVKLESAGQFDRLLAIANDELNEKVLSDAGLSVANRQALIAESFTADDLESGAQRSDGSINARFKRSDGAVVTIDILPGGQRLVTVVTDDE